MSTQPQPDPGPHLRHNSYQQLPVRAFSSSDNVLVSSTMQDHLRRTAPEDSSSLRQQSQAPMDTAIPPQLPGADKRENNKRGAAGGDMGGTFEQESSSREKRPQPTHNGDSGFASVEAGMFPSPPPEGPGNNAMLERKMQLRSPGGGAASGIGDGADGAPGEIDRESIAGSEAHKSVSEDWFNAFNRDVGGNNYSTLDDDPPYYLPNDYKKSNLDSVSRYARLNKIYPNRSSRAGMNRLHTTGSILPDSTEESNSDSFRSVIDDLTIKNQKLKKRLKKLEGLHGGNLAEEKLFEVRMHGLPLHKKQELERLLQGFASSLDNDASPAPSSKKSPENLMTPSIPSINPSSSLNIADSAYISNSRSGANSVAQSSHVKTKSHVARSSPASDKASSGSGMSSSPPAAITSERNKMKEVVRKLEQLFTGSKSKNSGSTPESTNSDRSGSNVGNVIHGEGARQASIMNPLQDKQAAEFSGHLVVPRSEPHAIGSVEIKNQRPTRPKDLDPKRLTKAEDNIEYLSNLTHSAGTGVKTEGLGDGWFFLNLLINMAQLHTISVTLPFVRKAILATSEKLELSISGEHVRWRGGLEGTRLSSGSSSGSGIDSASITSDGSPEDSWDGMRKRSPDDSDGRVMSIDPLSKSGSRGRVSLSSRRFPAFSPASVGERFHYKPLIAQLGALDDDTSSTLSTSMGSFPRGSSDEGGVSSVTKKTTPMDGPIIYYEGGKFCTDLTTQVVKDGKHPSGFPYERFTNNPIGEKPSHVPSSPNTKRESPLFSKDTPLSMPSGSDSMNIDSNCDVGLVFAPQFSSYVPQTPPPMELEASGIGGVLPGDNFAINVQKRHFLLPQNANGALPCSRKKLSKSRILRKISHQIPKSSIDAFQQNGDLTESGVSSNEESLTSEHEETSELDSGEERSAEDGADNSGDSDSESSEPATNSAKTRRRFNRHKIIHPQIVSAHMLRLEPSPLPPANFIYLALLDETSSVDTDSGADPQSSSSEDFLRMPNQGSTDIYGNSSDDNDYLGSDIAANGMRIHRPMQAATESGEAGSSAATAGDASGCSTPELIPIGGANMVPPTVNVMDVDGSNWGDSPDSGTTEAQLSSSAGNGDEDNFGMADRPTLKRGRGSGTSPSESTIGLVRKTARKSEKAISLDDLY